MRNLFSVALWGKDYVTRFLEVCLPTLLSPGNLGGMSRDADSRFLIITTEEDAVEIRRTAIFQTLGDRVATEFFIVPSKHSGNKYKSVSNLQMVAIEYSADFDTLFFLYPDFIFADGTISTALRRLQAGHDAVVLPVPRVLDHAVRDAFSDIVRAKNAAITLNPREFVAFANRHFHPAMWAHLWESGTFTSYPSNLFWRVAEGNLLFRCFHLHPLAIRVQFDSPVYTVRMRSTLDEEYIPRVFPDIGTIYCVPDSDEAAICSLTPESFVLSPLRPYQRPDILLVARWAEASASVLHRQFVRHPYRWHDRAMPAAEWQAAEAGSAALIERILERLKVPDMVLRIEDRIAYRMRRMRARRFGYWARPSSKSPLYVAAISDFHLWVILLCRLGFYRIAGPRFWRIFRWARSIWWRMRGTAPMVERPHADWIEILTHLQNAEIASFLAIVLEISRRTRRRIWPERRRRFGGIEGKS